MAEALDWLKDNTEFVSSVTTLATLLVWLVWLQLMYSDFRRRRQPRMLIHQGRDRDGDSQCLLVNLSQGVIHIQCVRVALIDGGNELSVGLVGEKAAAELSAMELENVLRQGPLREGEFMRLGSFEEILGRLDARSSENRLRDSGDLMLEIRVVAVYGDSDRSVGARRRFTVKTEDGREIVKPEDTYTRQMSRRGDRKVAEAWLRECLDD